MEETGTQAHIKETILNRDLAGKMRQLRLEAGLTQCELATLMKTGQPTIARWENGGRIPGLATLEALAHATGRKLEVNFI